MADVTKMANCRQFHRKAEDLLDQIEDLIKASVPQKGLKAEDCQHVTLMQAHSGMSMAVNGTTPEDF
jgi:hypothetical protein